MKQFTNFLFSFMDTGQNDMAGWFLVYLLNIFAEISINYLNSLFLQKLIQMTFFSEHGFAFHHLCDPFCFEDGIDDVIMLLGICSPVNLDTILLKVGFKLQKVIVKI